MSATASNHRIHGLDALRAGALLLGVVLHACMSYMPGAEYFWITSDQSKSVLASGAFFWIHSFRMLVFFLLAGYFGRQLLERYGAAVFVRNRVRRVLTPLLAGWPVVFSAIVAVIVWNAWLRHGGELPAQSSPGPRFTAESFPLTHLWFLYVLVLFYIAALGARLLKNKVLPRFHVPLANKAARALGAGQLGRWVAPLPMLAGFLLLPKWMPWFGIPTPDQSLYPNVAALFAYGSAFAYGWLLHAVPGGLAAHQKGWRSALAVALVASAACLAWVGPAPSVDVEVAGGDLQTAGFAALYAIGAWAWVYALLGVALTFAKCPSPARRYLSDASFWVYFAHLPLLAAGQVLMSRIEAPIWVELPVLLTVAFSLLLGSYHLLIRHTRLGRALGFSSHHAVAPVCPVTGNETRPLQPAA